MKKMPGKMDRDSFQANLNNIKELIMDEQKLVTYVSLSKDLCIHVNDSKRLLTEFVKNSRKQQPHLELNVCFMISGLTEDNKARTTVATEQEIQGVRENLKLVFFEHIYSINKGSSNVDNVAFLAVNRFDDFPLCTGLIKSSSCVKRSVDEIGNLKSNSQDAVQVEPKLTTLPQKKVKEEVVTNGHGTKNIIKVHESKSEPSIKTELTSPKKEASSSKTKIDNKKNSVKTQKGIAGFFNKANSVPSKILSKNFTEVTKELTVKREKSPVEGFAEEKMDVDSIKKNEIVEEVKPEIKKEQTNGKLKNKSLKQIKKTAKVDKKRKRVLHVSDSEDEDKDPFADEPETPAHESDDEIPPTPSANTIKITSGIINPKKRRKIVDKTYTDEEGYILTKKVEVYESCSDNEEDIIKENISIQPPAKKIKEETSPKDKKPAPKNTRKKVSPPQNGKQATLMTFFKRV